MQENVNLTQEVRRWKEEERMKISWKNYKNNMIYLKKKSWEEYSIRRVGFMKKEENMKKLKNVVEL